MSDERQAGFYWVRLYQDADWEIANYHGDGRSWQVLGEDRCFDTEDIFEVGCRVEKDATAMDTLKLFEIATTSFGESFVRSYAWCRSEEDARKLFARLNSGYELLEVNEVLAASENDVIFMPSDGGFGARATATEKAT
jgi:hypothetical protein